jgi:hypothetical protein
VKAASASRWDQRRFVSLGALFSGLALPVTGLADHLARHTSDGPHAGPGWIVAHVAISCLFVAFAGWHGYLNRRALVKYLRNKGTRPRLPSSEALSAFALVSVVLVVLIAHATLES